MALRSAVSACSRRLVFSSRSSEVASTDMPYPLVSTFGCQQLTLQLSEDGGDDPRRRQTVSIVQCRQGPCGQEFVRQANRRDLLADPPPHRRRRDRLEQAADDRVILTRQHQTIRVHLRQHGFSIKGL